MILIYLRNDFRSISYNIEKLRASTEMEYKHNFLKRSEKTSRVRIIMGLFLTIYSIYLVWDYPSNLGSILIFFIWGVNSFFEGIGIPPASLIGKKFILVNDEKIHFKFSLLKQGILLHTKDIDKIDLWPGSILVVYKNKKNRKIDLRDLNPQTRHDALMAIAAVAERRQIKYRKHGYLEHYN